MSELTTGSVSIPPVTHPVTVRETLQKSCTIAEKIGAADWSHYIMEIQNSVPGLSWSDKHTYSSPMKMVSQVAKLKDMVISNPAFIKMTEGLPSDRCDLLAGLISTQNSPLSNHITPRIANASSIQANFQSLLNHTVKEFAYDRFRYVHKIVRQAAQAAGFSGEIKILKESSVLKDIVFSNIETPSKKLSVYLKLDKNLNPSLALDLEGYEGTDGECSRVMDDLVKYLHCHGVPFNYKRYKHYQLSGVLRKSLEKNKEAEAGIVGNYLQTKQNQSDDYLKQH